MLNEHEKIENLIPDYALGILDEAESAMIETHLNHCSACQTVLASYEDLVGQLAFAAPTTQPSPKLEARLKERLQFATPTPTEPEQTMNSSWWQTMREAFTPRIPRWGIVALTVVVILLVVNWSLWQQLKLLDQPLPVDQQIINLMGTQGAQNANGYIIVDDVAGEYDLVVKNLPLLDASQQYQLWLIDNEERTNGAIFSVNPDGRAWVEVTASRPLSSYTAFGITIEPLGGSPGPTGEKVLGSTF